MTDIKEYTNSTEHNVIATAIDNLNIKNGLTYLEDENTIKDSNCKIDVIHGMYEILNEIHSLGYKIVINKG